MKYNIFDVKYNVYDQKWLKPWFYHIKYDEKVHAGAVFNISGAPKVANPVAFWRFTFLVDENLENVENQFL